MPATSHEAPWCSLLQAPPPARTGHRCSGGYLLTGDSGSNRNATRSLICFSVRTLFAPKRGMLEHATTACESKILVKACLASAGSYLRSLPYEVRLGPSVP